LEVKFSSLNEGDSFLLDVGNKLFVWHGRYSSARKKAKALFVGKKLAEEELGRVPIIVINGIV